MIKSSIFPGAILALNIVLCGCMGAGGEARPVTEISGGNSTASQAAPEPRIFTAKYVEANASSLIGKRILIDGYIGNICEKLAKAGCKHESSRRRFVLFGDPIVQLEDHYQPCASNGAPEVLLGGYFPASLGIPEGRRVIVVGVLQRKVTQLPQVVGSERRVLLSSTFQYVLQHVKVVKDAGTKCTFI